MTTMSYEVLPGQGGFGITNGWVDEGAIVKLTERQAKYLLLAKRVKKRADIASPKTPGPRVPRGRSSKKPAD
ncbi:hypothetical protein L1787_16515 [Acuticoccus sp. M5D2P5]|uniref:hypothetical protein n=1 Tax=Acuticoccus kalidii TaxID=2910977 RepID=UPI001F3F6D0D|nr:hypothetical protein [Acuticoccus kalidii]MCF3935009.1 hypothetical protein [Acuticoccus kalidii]